MRMTRAVMMAAVAALAQAACAGETSADIVIYVRRGGEHGQGGYEWEWLLDFVDQNFGACPQ